MPDDDQTTAAPQPVVYPGQGDQDPARRVHLSVLDARASLAYWREAAQHLARAINAVQDPDERAQLRDAVIYDTRDLIRQLDVVLPPGRGNRPEVSE